jgi:polysaccharide pyruvyl transferase WcaK-like protein
VQPTSNAQTIQPEPEATHRSGGLQHTGGKRPPRVLIANAWGSNRGDEAMLNTLYLVIASIAPGAEVHVAPFRDETLDLDPGMQVLRNRAGQNRYVPLPQTIARRTRSGIGRALLRRGLTWIPSLAEASMRRLVQAYDLVLHAPQGPGIGDMYQQKVDLLRILNAARLAGVPYAIIGCSVGPFAQRTADEQYTHEVLRGARAIVVREDISLSYLLTKYPDIARAQSAIDIVFAMPAPTLEELLPVRPSARQAASMVTPDTIGACISVTPARDPNNAFSLPDYVAGFVRLLNHVLDQTSAPLLLFPHISHDLPCLETIARRVHSPNRVQILQPQADSDVQRAVIAKLAFLISSRYHPTVFAVQSRVPFLCIKNQFKVEGMLDKLGLGHLPACWQDDPIEFQQRMFDESWSGRDHVRNTLDEAANRATALAQAYSKTLMECLPA